MSEAIIVREFPVSAARLYAVLADQDALGSWLGVKVSVPTRSARGLVGTVRHIHLGPFAFDERIVTADPEHAIDYLIVPPMPLLKYHRGEMRIEPRGAQRSRLQWRVVLELKLGMDRVVLPFVKQALSLGLTRLEKQLTAAAHEQLVAH